MSWIIAGIITLAVFVLWLFMVRQMNKKIDREVKNFSGDKKKGE